MNSVKKFLKENIKGMSLIVIMMIIAVFSVFIVGTYTILNRHIIRTTEAKAGQGAYYVAEGILRMISTDVDKKANEIARAADEANEDLSADEFTDRLNAALALWTDDDVRTEASHSFTGCDVIAATIEPEVVATTKYTCVYKLTAIIRGEDLVTKRVTGSYGVIFLSSNSQSTSYNRINVDENSSMLIALQDITAEEEVSLNGKVELRGDFTYPEHYPYHDDPTKYENEGFEYAVTTTSLTAANVKIPNIPQPPTSEYYTEPQYTRQPRSIDDYSTALVDQTEVLPRNNGLKYYEYDEMTITNVALVGRNAGKLTLNVNADDCYIRCHTVDWDNLVTINANGKDFIWMIDDKVTMKNGAKLTVNLGNNDVYLVVNGFDSARSGIVGQIFPDQVSVTTTGTGTLYIFINGFTQYDIDQFTADFTNESKVSVVFLCDFYTGTDYNDVVFNANTPAGASKAGDLNIFVADDDQPSHFTINRDSKLRFNTAAGTKLSIIADHVNIEGQMEIGGNATLNLYARKDCTIEGDPDHPERNLSNFTFDDSGMTDSEKAAKIVDTKFNVYYYGLEPLILSDYKCCSNLFVADFADIIISETKFYGNIYSAARDPEGGEYRRQMIFTDSYLSCGALYTPRMDIRIEGDPDRSFTQKFSTNDGLYSACVFASITGTNIDLYGDTIIKTTTVKSENELVIVMEYNSGVVSDGSKYESGHFYRGFKEE